MLNQYLAGSYAKLCANQNSLFLRQQLWGLQKEASLCGVGKQSFFSVFVYFVNPEGAHIAQDEVALQCPVRPLAERLGIRSRIEPAAEVWWGRGK